MATRKPKSTDKGMSQAAYAEYRREKGLPIASPSQVSVALKAGRIKKNKFGRLDREECDRLLEISAPKGINEKTAREMAESKANRARVLAEREKFNLEVAQGKMMSRDEVEIKAGELGKFIRESVCSSVRRKRSKLAKETDPKKVQEMIFSMLEKSFDDYGRLVAKVVKE